MYSVCNSVLLYTLSYRRRKERIGREGEGEEWYKRRKEGMGGEDLRKDGIREGIKEGMGRKDGI